tara:strand:- start:4223 stop:5212 length:990 start_codon:yes stop_codon:yes gene_type:complete
MIFEEEAGSGFPPFQAHFLVRGGFWQTVLGSRGGDLFESPPMRCHKLKINSKASLMIFEYPAKNNELPVVIMAHGMGGCSESNYMKRIGAYLHKKGYGVFLMNHRGSGLGMGLCDSLWNGGSSNDLSAVVNLVLKVHPNHPVIIIGFSLSGNILLKYFGENRSIPPYVIKGLAVNPPVDLRTSSHLLSNKGYNRFFNRYYMKMIHNQAKALMECYPDAFHPPLDAESIWEFDEAYTAPVAGYRDVEEYYYRCSANRILAEIKQPVTILYSSNDPFIPSDVFKEYPSSEYVELVGTSDGGHMGYISRHCSKYSDRRWMDHFILHWVERGK